MIFGYDAEEAFHPFYVCQDDTVHLPGLVHTWYREPIVFEVPECCDAIILIPFDNLDITPISGAMALPASQDFFPSPNPFTTYLRYESEETDQLEIYDVAGRLLWVWQVSFGLNVLDVGDFSSGVYFLRSEKSGQTRKLVKIE